MATTSNKGPAPGADHRTFLFGAFVLDVDRGALLKDGADVPLRPKCFKVLSYLVEHHGLLVSKDEVLGAVWPGVVVTEDSLTQCLIQIRKVLGDDSRDMIRTVPRRGYLFDVPVTVHEPDKDPVAPGAPDSLMSSRRPSRWSVGAGIILALAIAVNWWNARIQHVEDRMPTYVQASILPDSVSASVSDTPNAKAHGHYLQGKFFYSRRGSGDIERAMQHFQRALEIDPDLADAWVGLASSMIIHAFRNGIPWEETVARRKEALDKAIELDPNHAEAHIRLAQHYRRLSEMDTARQHYDEALRYGQNSALVLSMAAGTAFHEANFEQAIELQMRAVALDPLGFANRENLAGFLFHAGRFDEAEVEFLNALDLNPAMSDYINDNLVQILVLQQQCEAAGVLIQQLPEGIARDQGLAIFHHVRGQEAEANAAIARLTADPGVEPAARLAEIYAFRGNLDESFKWLDSARDRIYKTGRNSSDWQDLRLLFTSPFLRPLHDDPRWEMWLAEMETRTS